MKIGILGGTFDPPHFGHLLIAQEVLCALKLDEIWLMPNASPPHKGSPTAEVNHRVEMIRRAIADNPQFKLQMIELERGGRSYTIDTMIELKKSYQEAQFFFIIGADMVEFLPKWKRIDELLRLVTFVGVKRPGYQLQTDYDIREVDVPQFDVSSTFLRERFRTGKNTKYYLPDEVRTYIEENNVYDE